MRLRILTLLTLTMLCSLPLLANAATYNWYFSDDAAGNAAGNDTTGDGSIGNPWKTLSKAKTQIDTAGSGDTVNLYFDRGDTWNVNTRLKVQIHGFEVESTNAIVNMDAYGSGNLPCIDGGITDFSLAPKHNVTTGPLFWSQIFKFSRTNCSISNMEFKQIYGDVIRFQGANGFQLSNCNIHHFGAAANVIKTSTVMTNAVIEYNTVHTGQQLWRYGKRPSGWGGGISFSAGHCYDNIVRYNLVYDIFGEGINNPGGITEYNVVGDTYSAAIYGSPLAPIDTRDTVMRYNFVIMSGSSDYRPPYPIPSIHNGRTAYNGIGLIDERVVGEAGSNSNADIEIYGNIVINAYYGIYAKNANVAANGAFKSIKIYNNLVIDCSLSNYYVSFPEGFDAGYVYNNSSILYDRTTSNHTNNNLDAGWDVDNNHFWTTGGSPVVGYSWRKNYVTTDPKLPGEPTVDWDGQRGATYYKDIDFNTHLYPPADSPLFNTSKSLGAGYSSTFLTYGTDFGTLPDKATFKTASQADNWDIGAICNTSGVTPLDSPKDFKLLK